MSGDGKTSGNGKTSPFGNGDGKDRGTNMAGIDFVKNPAGNPSGRAGVDFIANPGGSGPSGQRPPDFAAQGDRTQKRGEDPDLDKSSIPAGNGGKVLQADPNTGGARDIGVGSIGDNRKPFKLNG